MLTLADVSLGPYKKIGVTMSLNFVLALLLFQAPAFCQQQMKKLHQIKTGHYSLKSDCYTYK